jgi:hypothetical protein
LTKLPADLELSVEFTTDGLRKFPEQALQVAAIALVVTEAEAEVPNIIPIATTTATPKI